MTILLTKVRAPQRRKDVLRRVRLIDILHQNLHRKLTFVSAPAGYGKTTLLVDFAADVDALVFWYRISPEDSDLVQFVQHLVAAFQQHKPKFGLALSDKLNTPGGSPDAATLAVDLINEVEEKLDDFSVLILDDYHLAGENQQIVDFIENLLENLPDRLRILMGSRSVYGIPTANLYIRDELVTISADELRFRADELQKLVLQNHRVRLSDEQAQEFAMRADGWIIAILLALRTMENDVLPDLSGGVERIYTYLAEEVVNRQSEELRDFMLATSILGDFNEAVCNYLLQSKDAAEYLRALEERNLFVSRTETSEGPSYRYHQLFAEFLQDYFVRNQKPRLQELHRRAAAWYREREEWERAVHHKLQAGDKQEAANWVDKVAVEFYTSGRQMLIARWMEQLAKPPDLRKHAPHLLLYQAKLLGTQGQFQAALKLLNLAEPALAKLKGVDALANAMITRGMIYRFTGKHREALKLAEKAQGLLRGKRKPELRQKWFQAERLKALPLNHFRKTTMAIHSLETAANGLRYLADANEPALQIQYLYDLAECLNDLGLLQINSGNMLAAQKAFREALDIHLRINSNLGAMALARNNLAYIYHQSGQYPEAWREYSLALDHAKAANQLRWQRAILTGRAELLLEVDEKVEGLDNLEQALAIRNQSEPESALIYLGMARAERKRGQYSEALNWLRKAASLSTGTLEEADYALELGLIYADMGQGDLAIKEFEKTISDWPKDKTPKQAQVLAAFLAARSSFEAKEFAKAEKLLNQSLEGAARLGYDQFLVVAARPFTSVLKQFAAFATSAQLQALVERAENFVAGRSMLASIAPELKVKPIRMEIHAFGTGEIRRNGELLHPNIWRSTRARALFFFILDRGKVRKETIGLSFWPDFSSGKISSNFHATLWRVRQALGFREAIVFDNDQYSLHPSIQIWYDVGEFETLLAKARHPSISKSERSEAIKQALDLYQQPYLQDIYMEWTDLRREELRNVYQDGLLELATIESSGKHYRAAKQLYEKVLAIDPYRDEVHLALMQCLALSGAASAAIAHFNDYRTMLRKELNAEPLPELKAYYEQLAVKA
ncbi:MAG: BTAD domain-containing putative transcriptional regulator [Anaerolineales bacterium]